MPRHPSCIRAIIIHCPAIVNSEKTSIGDNPVTHTAEVATKKASTMLTGLFAEKASRLSKVPPNRMANKKAIIGKTNGVR